MSRPAEQALADVVEGYAKLYALDDYGHRTSAGDLAQQLIDFAGEPVPEVVVDVGCGRGYGVRVLRANRIRVVAVDVVDCLDRDLLADPGVTFLRRSILDLDPGMGDWFLCVGVTSSIPDALLPEALDRLAACARRGGLWGHCLRGQSEIADRAGIPSDRSIITSELVHINEDEAANLQVQATIKGMMRHHLHPRHHESTIDGEWYYAKVRYG